MNRAHIEEMLQLQSRLNSVVNPDWFNAGYPWHRAMYVEAVEALDHLGWKWWKAPGESNAVQIQLELVDIWHFAMSNILVTQGGDLTAATDVITDYFQQLENDPDVFGEIANVDTPKLFDLLAGSAALQRQLNGPAFNMLMKRFDLTWHQLYRMYLAKNVLNLFRQANGYKDGSYIKVWSGVEDNVVLERLMASHPSANSARLLELLGERYGAVNATDA